jgi:hypothetical protein
MDRILFLTIAEVDQNRGHCVAMEEKSWAQDYAKGCRCSRRTHMARKYSRGASKDVRRAMRKRKRGTLRSGRSGKKVKSRKQAIAIGLSEARKKGKKVPRKGKGGRRKRGR